MKRLLILPLLLLNMLPLWAATGHVKGRIINATLKKPLAGASISLIRIGPDRQDRTVGTTKSGPDGAFSFSAFPAGANEIFMAQTMFLGKKYEQVAFDGTGRLKEIAGMDVDPDKIELTVYSKSGKMPEFRFLVHHLAIQRENRTLKCVERIVVKPQVNYFYDGSAGVSKIKLQLSTGAKEVALDPKIVNGTLQKEGDFYYFVFKNKSMIFDTRQPTPILINYVLDWPASLPWNRKLNLDHKIFYSTNFFFVARAPDAKDLKVIAPRLKPDETNKFPNAQGETIEKIVNSIGDPMSQEAALKAGETVAITLQQPVNPLVWAFVMFVGALIAIVPLVLRNSGGRRAESDFADDEVSSNLQEPAFRADVLGETFRPTAGAAFPTGKAAKRSGTPQGAQDLIFSIAQLDEEFASGEVDEQTYQTRRALWKKELVSLLEQEQKQSVSVKTGRTKK